MTIAFHIMYNVFSTMLFMLPGFGFAIPAQPIESLRLTAANPAISNPVGIQSIDPRFALLIRYDESAGPLEEDQFLVSAVQVMGL